MGTVLESRYVKTRKPHPCYLCGNNIQAGSEVYSSSSVDQGEFLRVWMHSSCMKYTETWTWEDWEAFSEGYQGNLQENTVRIETWTHEHHKRFNAVRDTMIENQQKMGIHEDQTK